MNWWTALPEFWRGFICGGVAVPGAIVLIEIAYKLIIRNNINR